MSQLSFLKMERKVKQKTIAENRAPVFARPASTSTPTGYSSSSTDNDKAKKESWPGPFATAREIMSKREEAKRLRDEQIQGDSIESLEPDEMDEYDLELSTLQWTPSNQHTPQLKCASLTDLCIKSCLANLNISSQDINKISDDNRNKFLLEIAKIRQLTPSVALAFAVDKSGILCLPECSLLPEETLIQAFNTISHRPNILASSSEAIDMSDCVDVRVIQLWNAGHGFSDKVATLLHDRVSELEVFHVTGLYRLSDESLAKLLQCCSGSLRHLDLTSNCRICTQSMQSIRLDVLTTLVLDHSINLTDDHLKLLCNSLPSYPSSMSSLDVGCCLETLSLIGLTNITDAGIQALLSRVGSKLQSLSVGQCELLTDETLVHIRTYCHSLQELDISVIPTFSTPALIGLFILDPRVLFGQPETEPGSYDSANVTKSASMSDHSSELLSIGHLRTVNLRGLGSVTDDVILQLALCSGQSLTSLNINSCYQITGKSVIAVTKHCSNLSFLDMSFVRKPKEDTLGHMVEKCSALTELYVWGCTQLTHRFYKGIRTDLNIVGKPNWGV